MDEPVLKIPTLNDCESSAACHIQCWIETYTGQIPDSVLAGRTLQRRTAFWRDEIIGHPESIRVVIAVDPKSKVVGLAGATVTPDPESGNKELLMLYVLKEWQKRGLGTKLLQAVVDSGAPVVAWVLETNTEAAKWYQRMGFQRTQGRKYHDLLESWEVEYGRHDLVKTLMVHAWEHLAAWSRQFEKAGDSRRGATLGLDGLSSGWDAKDTQFLVSLTTNWTLCQDGVNDMLPKFFGSESLILDDRYRYWSKSEPIRDPYDFDWSPLRDATSCLYLYCY
ncbi:acyl-CoA N-acyltransferase [Mycena floridula]|nr:acyl-CoA N-acyltransferase [Mycena floridula]